MKKDKNVYVLTCNCYAPMFREDVKVEADDLDDAFDKAKVKLRRKYKARKEDIHITATKLIREVYIQN